MTCLPLRGARVRNDRPALTPPARARKGARSGGGIWSRILSRTGVVGSGNTSSSYLLQNPTINRDLAPRSREVISSAFPVAESELLHLSLSGQSAVRGSAVDRLDHERRAEEASPGGVNVGMADGSVRYVKDSVNLLSWRALSTTRGKEVVSSDAY